MFIFCFIATCLYIPKLNQLNISKTAPGMMSSTELVGEGPIFLTIKKVRGKPFMIELKENIQKMRSENILRFLLMNNKVITHNSLLGMMLKF